MDEPIRFTNSLTGADYKGLIQNYAKKRDANIIGDGTWARLCISLVSVPVSFPSADVCFDMRQRNEVH